MGSAASYTAQVEQGKNRRDLTKDFRAETASRESIVGVGGRWCVVSFRVE